MKYLQETWHKAALFCATVVLLWCLSNWSVIHREKPGYSWVTVNDDFKSWCPLADPEDLIHRDDGLRASSDFTSLASLTRQVERLSAAVRVPTESFDDNGDVDVDPRWEIFNELHRVFIDLFPMVYVVRYCIFRSSQ